MLGKKRRWKRGQQQSNPRGMMEATLVFIKGAGAGMVQELSGGDKGNASGSSVDVIS